MNRSSNLIIRLLSSFRTSVVLLLLYAILLASATWIEKSHGTSVAKNLIYYSPLFFLLQILLVVNFLIYAGKHQYLSRGRLGLLLTHLAFIVILAGAFITHRYGTEGLVHVREGESTDIMLVREGENMSSIKLPFTIELNDFVLRRYPGSDSPSSYESMVTVRTKTSEYEAHIFMNNVLDIDGYRLFQSSYDQDEKGSILSINHDVVGRSITYTGYIVLVLGLLFSLINRNGRFRFLNRRLKLLNTRQAVVLIGIFFSLPLFANGGKALLMAEKYIVNADHAERFGRLPIQSVSGRMMPVSTLSSEILRKLHKSENIGQLNSDQFLISLFLMPDVWINIPFIYLDDKELAKRYDIDAPYSSYTQMFDSAGNYKLQNDLDIIYRKDLTQRNVFEKDVLKLDEQINIFHLLMNRKQLNLFPLPNDSTHTWYAPGDDLSLFSEKDSLFVSLIFNWYLEEVTNAINSGNWEKANEVVGMIDTYQQSKAVGVDISHERLSAEVRYNRLNVFRYCRIGYLILGGLSLVWAFGTLFGLFRLKFVKWLLVACTLLVFLFHMYGMGMRWYISGYAPWSNSYEAMVYVAWATVFGGLLFARRNLLVFALATLFGGVILFVSGLNWMDPQITPLVPVLKSPWLMFHVAVIVAAYGFFGLSSLVGITNLMLLNLLPLSKRPYWLSERINEFSVVNEMSLWIGLVLMTTGTFLGAVWANESWGRYWGWDPKETWALITVVVYAIVTHIHLLNLRMGEWLFNLLSVLALSTVLMTFFGVNYLLSGMHSYGKNDNISNLFIWIAMAFGFVFFLGVLSYKTASKYCNK